MINRDIIQNMLVDCYLQASDMKMRVRLLDKTTGEVYYFTYDTEPFHVGMNSVSYARCLHYGTKAKRDLAEIWKVNTDV